MRIGPSIKRRLAGVEITETAKKTTGQNNWAHRGKEEQRDLLKWQKSSSFVAKVDVITL